MKRFFRDHFTEFWKLIKKILNPTFSRVGVTRIPTWKHHITYVKSEKYETTSRGKLKHLGWYCLLKSWTCMNEKVSKRRILCSSLLIWAQTSYGVPMKILCLRDRFTAPENLFWKCVKMSESDVFTQFFPFLRVGFRHFHIFSKQTLPQWNDP